METNQNGQGVEKGKVCNCQHHKVVPIVIAITGLAILLTAFNAFTPFAEAVTIGIALLVIGLTKLFSGNCRCC